MNTLLQNLPNYVNVFLFVLIRVTSIFIVSPIFGRRNMPTMLKLGFGVLISFIIFPTIDLNAVKKYDSVFEIVSVILNEFMVGLILGFVSYMCFQAIYIAGQIIDMQVGFSMVNTLDPQSNIQMPITATFFNIIAMLLFLALNGHHMLISAVFYSYKILPIGSATLGNVLMTDMLKMFSDMFVIGFKIAAPIMAAIFITDLALGILSKTVPQMNVFVVGMPIKIFVGIVVLVMMLPVFSSIMEVLLDGMYADLEKVIRGMVPQ